MNTGYYETLNENFAQALNLYEQEYSHGELIALLKDGNIVQKQIAALKLDGVYSDYDARVLVDNLTGQDGKIREAVSLKLNEFMANSDFLPYFKDNSIYTTFLDAIIDINANICRNVISAVSNLKDDEDFCKIFCTNLINLTLDLLSKVEEFDFQEGKYKINKEVFKLYWCLETVYEFCDKIEFPFLKQIILRSKNVQEYTIREKAAKILSKGFEDSELLAAQQELRSDKNYYVRRY